MIRFLSFALLAALCMPLGLIAQTDSSYRMDTVAISSSRMDQARNETGRNITVLTAQEIQQLPANSLDELLRYLPGVEVRSRNGFGAQADISMRGATFAQVLVLVDGVRLNDPLTGHFNAYVPVSISEISRIEVLRGAASAMYGPDAVGGVIHVITKTFDAQLKEAQNFGAEVVAGEYDLFSAQAGVVVKKENGLRASAGILFNKSNGQPLPPDSSDIRNDFDIRTITASLGYDFGNGWEAIARVGYDYRMFNAQYFYTTSTLDKSREEATAFWPQLKVRHTGDKSTTEFDMVYKVSTDSFLFSEELIEFVPANIHTMKQFVGQVNHRHQFSDEFTFAVGGQFDQRQIESTDRGDHQDYHVGGYVMGYYRPIDGLNLTASVRGDYDQNYGFELLPQLNASYAVSPRVNVRGSVGRSIRAADYTERYNNYLKDFIPALRSIGNPDLEAESAWSYEVGADVALAPGVQVIGTGFLRSGNNLIDYMYTFSGDIPGYEGKLEDSSYYFYAQNLSNVNTAGFELELDIRKQVNQDVFVNGRLGYTYMDSFNEEGSVSKYISNHSAHLVTAYAGVNWKKFQFSVNGLFKDRDAEFAEAIDRELTAQYSVWNVKARYQLLQDKFGLSAQINNVFDADYSDFLGAKMPGRWLMVGLNANL
ncbi:TonB-dependent receptor [Pontibacter sp. G13]|uniref:TonB-dependent receptor plug domain-containing protein n=1 Tax=Pontibacter sp. G13 TaxID=3074898 RepID=UPI0028891437|nr:TonB-dependent receptor [Pontibacter sp. G13]WNJ19149.1 TonB-dependent receptor [Pontibacter sp. G13]